MTRPDRAVSASASTELLRGALVNTIVLLATTLRSIFTILIARLLGSAILGTWATAFATMDLLNKFANLGLDSSTVVFVAAREAVGDRAGSRSVFRRALLCGLIASVSVTLAAIAIVLLLGGRIGWRPEL